MDSIEKLISAITMVEEARGVPLSASCVVHRGEMLELLDDARQALPSDFDSAQKVISARDAIIEEARLSAEQMISMAREDVARMVEQTSIVQIARDEARKILGDAREQGILEKEAMDLNKRFFTFHQQKQPYIILKWAQSRNHKIAHADYSRVQITNDYTNRLVHRWRSEEAGIMVGTNTALQDNPSLNVRHLTGKDPIRLVVDMNLRLPNNLKIFNIAS